MLEDAAELSNRRNRPVFTDFLTEAEQVTAVSVMKRLQANYWLWGGFDGAERRMLGVFPPYDEPCAEPFPIDGKEGAKAVRAVLKAYESGREKLSPA